MKNFKNSFCIFAILVCLYQTSFSQSCVQFFPTANYDCIVGQTYVSYTIAGGAAPYSYTLVNVVTNATVSSGFITTVPTGTMVGLPPGSYNYYLQSAVPSCTGTQQFQSSLPFTISNPIVTTASVTCYGANNGSASVVAPTSFSANPSYTWASATSAVYTQTLGNMIAGVVYTVTIRDAVGCETKTSVVVPEPPEINSTLTNTFITCYGQTLNSPVISTGNIGTTNYTVNGLGLPQNTALGLAAGVQTIITRDNANNCVKTNTVLINQGPKPTINFTKSSPNCPGGFDGSMNASVSAPPGFQYSWQPVGSTGQNIVNIPAGTYTLTVWYNNGACVTQSITNLDPAVSASVTSITNPENCSAMDGAYTLSVNGASAPFTFSTLPFGAQPSNTLANLSSGNYTVLTGYNFNPNNNSYCIDTSIVIIGNLSTVSVSIQNSVSINCYSSCNASVTLNVLNALQPVTYSATGNQTTTANTFTNLCAGFYNIKAVDANGCPATTTINLIAPPVLTFTATGPSSVCVGQAANLQAGASGGTGNYTFVWKPGNIQGQVINLVPNGTTVYSLNAYDANGCTMPAMQHTVTVAPQLTVNISSSSSGICPGTTAQITPTVSGGDGNYTYNWYPGNSTAASIFVQNITVPVYTVVVKDGCGSPTVTRLININLLPNIKPEFTSMALSGCEPLCTKFINKTPKSSNVIWNYGDSPTEKRGDTTSYCYLKHGKYSLTLSLRDSNYCKTAFTFSNAVTVYNTPKSDFITSPEYITLSNADQVFFKSNVADAVHYQWYVEQKYCGTTTDINFAFADTGCYKVKLIAENKNSCADTVERYVCVSEDFNFYMPNCFTPNGSGLNDILVPKGTGWIARDFMFEVYDRWGKRLFISTDLLKGWDGTNSEEETPYALYIWKVNVTDLKGTEHKYAGTVTLLR